MIIVDASVAVKWLIEELQSDVALALLTQEDDLFGPELLDIEVRSAITRRVNMGELAPEAGTAALQKWRRVLDSFSLQLMPASDLLLDRAFSLAVELRHPFKDIVYTALAMEQEAALVTADQRLFKKGGSIYPQVRHLRDWI